MNGTLMGWGGGLGISGLLFMARADRIGFIGGIIVLVIGLILLGVGLKHD